MNHSTSGLPVHHQLPEPTQTRVHRVGDAIQPSHPLSSPLLPPSVFPSIRVFSDESALRIKWAKYWSFSFSISPSNEYSGLISFNIDWLNQSILKVSLGVAKCPLGAKITAPPPHVPQIENHWLKAIWHRKFMSVQSNNKNIGPWILQVLVAFLISSLQ